MSATRDDLAARRAAVLARKVEKDCAADLARIAQLGRTQARAWAVASSIRRHPSNPTPFDWEAEG